LDLTAIAVVKCQHAEGCKEPLKKHFDTKVGAAHFFFAQKLNS